MEINRIYSLIQSETEPPHHLLPFIIKMKALRRIGEQDDYSFQCSIQILLMFISIYHVREPRTHLHLILNMNCIHFFLKMYLFKTKVTDFVASYFYMKNRNIKTTGIIHLSGPT